MSGDRFHGVAAGRVIAAQLGRKTAIGFRVSGLCEHGWPAVIRSNPFDISDSFNPNIYYLTCPFLRKKISTLESEGAIIELQESLIAERALAAAVRRAQETHAREWLVAAAAEDGDASGKQPRDVAGRTPRIADSRDDLLLKCLHAHYGFYLVHDGYVLGKMIAERLAARWCDDDQCRRLIAGEAG